MDERLAHSKSNFNYWLKQLKGFGIIEERNEEVCLTMTGQWAATTTAGTIEQRIDFLATGRCKNCSTPNNIEFLTPLMNESQTSSKGNIATKAVCPKCKSESFIHIHSMGAKEFSAFYKKALKELGQKNT